MDESITAARDQLATDLKAVIADAEDLLKATAGVAGERVSEARARAEETLRTLKAKLANLDEVAVARARQAARAADDYVHEHPWSAVGIAGVAGLLIGVLIARR